VDTAFTVLDGDRATEVDARLDGGRVLLTAADVLRATGWDAKPEGLCRDGACIPLRDPSVHHGERLDLGGVARALRRPLALDVEQSAACLGAAAAERTQALQSLRAPDFSLPDLSGRMHTLSAQRGRKVLLVAYASW